VGLSSHWSCGLVSCCQARQRPRIVRIVPTWKSTTAAPVSRSAAATHRSCASGATCRVFFEEPRRSVRNAIHPAVESYLPLNRRTTCRPRSTVIAAIERQVGHRRSLRITAWFQGPAPNAITKLPRSASRLLTFRRPCPATAAIGRLAGWAQPSNIRE